MNNQHRHITGYRELSAGEIALMNSIKEEGERLQALVHRVKDHVHGQYASLPDMDDYKEMDDEQRAIWANEEDRMTDADPLRWVGTAQTDLQTALMALTRAVAQPTTFA